MDGPAAPKVSILAVSALSACFLPLTQTLFDTVIPLQCLHTRSSSEVKQGNRQYEIPLAVSQPNSSDIASRRTKQRPPCRTFWSRSMLRLPVRIAPSQQPSSRCPMTIALFLTILSVSFLPSILSSCGSSFAPRQHRPRFARTNVQERTTAGATCDVDALPRQPVLLHDRGADLRGVWPRRLGVFRRRHQAYHHGSGS